ncbi:MAG: hypothetical protein JWQ03_615 [Variovorax sp.]|nr:hypothetical protein [Variovorax sp.]
MPQPITTPPELDPDAPEHELAVGVLTVGETAQVAIDFGEPCDLISFPPDLAVHLAQLIVKNARLAGYTGPFVELPVQAQQTIN